MNSPDPPRVKTRTTDIRTKVSFARRFSFARMRIFYGKNFLNLRPRFRDRFTWIWTFVVLAAAAIIFFSARGLSTRAEVKDFFPTTCLGDWKNPSLAVGEPESMAASDTVPSAPNSASYDGTENQIFCNGFVPADADTSSSVTSVGLMLVWNVGSSADDGAATSSPLLTIATETDAGSSSLDIAPARDASDTNDMSPTDTISVPAAADSTSTPAFVPTPSPSPLGTPTPSPSATPTPTPALAPPPTPDAQDTPAAQDDAATTTALIPGGRFWASLVPRAFADEISDPSSTTGDIASATDSIMTEDTSTVIDAASGTDMASGTDVTPVPAAATTSDATSTADATDTNDNFLEINYSIDGTNWIPLGEVNVSDLPDFTVSVPVTNWSDLQHLEIQVEGISTTQDPIPTVYLDGMFLEVQYEDPSGVVNDSSLYPHFFVDGTEYTMGDQIALMGAPPESYIEIYSFNDPDSSDAASNDYAIQTDNDGATTIDTNTLVPGRYILVNTFEPGACNEYTIAECRARVDYIGESEIIVDDSSTVSAAAAP
jgi:hypothetical protein